MKHAKLLAIPLAMALVHQRLLRQQLQQTK